MPGERESVPSRSTGPLIDNKAELAPIEARNALLQFDAVLQMIPERAGDLRLTVADICELQRLAVQDIWPTAGELRTCEISISNSNHDPPPPNAVSDLVEEMCVVANENAADGVWTCSYLMWRLNWIHPFNDGNGRTSRAVGYLALCAGLGLRLPGTVTVPEMIAGNKAPYYHALDAADEAWAKDGKTNVDDMQAIVLDLLERQLRSADEPS